MLAHMAYLSISTINKDMHYIQHVLTGNYFNLNLIYKKTGI